MAAATAYSTSNAAFHPHSLTTSRAQFSPTRHRTSSSSSTSLSSTAPLTFTERSSIIRAIKSDENNNEEEIEETPLLIIDDVLDVTSDNEMDNSEQNDDIDEEQFLACVGLRRKNTKRIITKSTLPPLTKRFACPVCLLPLPKFSQRVRQALYIRLPFLKFLSITCDLDSFCSTDENARAQSLLPRSAAQARALSAMNRSVRKQKLAKTEFVSMAANTLRNSTSEIAMSKYIQSVLQCNVALDRLEQSAIDQIMQNSMENNDVYTSISPTSQEILPKTSPKTRRSLKISQNQTTKTKTTVTTTTIEKTVVKRKLTTTTTTDIDKSKRFKSVESDPTVINDHGILPSLIHQRIYLKCFVCSKRQYVDASATDSDVLHSHWLEHDGDLSLNIYDSEIDSILTRVVEFFHLPRQHLLEGIIQKVFIYNSKEIRSTSTTALSSNDSYIVID